METNEIQNKGTNHLVNVRLKQTENKVHRDRGQSLGSRKIVANIYKTYVIK
jgi:hypothetical protein